MRVRADRFHFHPGPTMFTAVTMILVILAVLVLLLGVFVQRAS